MDEHRIRGLPLALDEAHEWRGILDLGRPSEHAPRMGDDEIVPDEHEEDARDDGRHGRRPRARHEQPHGRGGECRQRRRDEDEDPRLAQRHEVQHREHGELGHQRHECAGGDARLPERTRDGEAQHAYRERPGAERRIERPSECAPHGPRGLDRVHRYVDLRVPVAVVRAREPRPHEQPVIEAAPRTDHDGGEAQVAHRAAVPPKGGVHEQDGEDRRRDEELRVRKGESERQDEREQDQVPTASIRRECRRAIEREQAEERFGRVLLEHPRVGDLERVEGDGGEGERTSERVRGETRAGGQRHAHPEASEGERDGTERQLRSTEDDRDELHEPGPRHGRHGDREPELREALDARRQRDPRLVVREAPGAELRQTERHAEERNRRDEDAPCERGPRGRSLPASAPSHHSTRPPTTRRACVAAASEERTLPRRRLSADHPTLRACFVDPIGSARGRAPLFGLHGERADYYDASIGGRVNLWRDTVIGFANVIVPLNDAGVRTEPVPLVGIEVVLR